MDTCIGECCSSPPRGLLLPTLNRASSRSDTTGKGSTDNNSIPPIVGRIDGTSPFNFTRGFIMAIQANPTELDSVINAIAFRLSKGAGRVRRDYNLSFFTFNVEFLPATLNAFTNGSFLVQNDSAWEIGRAHV